MEDASDDRPWFSRLIEQRIRMTVGEKASLELALSKLRAALRDRLIDVYEAGGGARPVSARWFAESRLTVVDLDDAQGGASSTGHDFVKDDIRRFRPVDRTFDLIVCYYVLEHVSNPERALDNFCALAAPNGLIFIASPCFWSINALTAKLTPHWFHVWFYRTILKKPAAGTKGKAPFPTHHSALIDPDRLARYFASRKFELVYQRRFLNDHLSKLIDTKPVLAVWVEVLIRLANRACLNRIDFGEGDFHLIVRRTSHAASG